MENKFTSKFYEESLKIRLFEKKLLEFFSRGLIKGTTHTCLGQENNAVGVCAALNSSDIVLSNHRCHGHFLAHTKNFEGLLDEILGKESGVCKGVGGSQHLFYKKIFYSNGILGGNLPMSVGLAKAKKLKKSKNIVCIFLGDGSFGEGVLYESLNIISIYKLPILLVVEDNGIAQTTDTKKTISGSLFDKCKSFNIDVIKMKYPDAAEIYKKTKKIVQKVKKNKPQVMIIESTRLGPHSKGDDTRSKKVLNHLNKIDPLKKLEKKIKDKKLKVSIEEKSKNFIENLFDKSLKNNSSQSNRIYKQEKTNLNTSLDYLESFKGKRFGELINHYFLNLAKRNKEVLFFGEDIVDPYGGAFKITKNIQQKFPKQIFFTPISEATIVGMASGLAIEGYKPIVEIMFGDFLGLSFDQILNNLSKFYFMYAKEINLPLVIRTPMGAGRGYGPTHSQSIEKHFFGIIGLNIYALNPFFPIHKIYEKAFNSNTPSLVLENKLQYNFIIADKENSYFKNFKINNFENEFISTLSLTNFESEDCTIFCYGGTSEITLKAVHDLFIENETSCKVIILSKLDKINENFIKKQVSPKGPIFVIEEASKLFGFGSELGSIFNEDQELKKREFMRISSKDEIIPSSPKLEKNSIISSDLIKYNISKLIDA